ncbi:glycosyltransferase family 2 protein [Chitinophaga cymbidii]|uniref:Glycosyltransferase 2-like domain-containing protein n=1 Tax=Chitinophaga cymbidii TaxID=1096750 RepID=A0A512RNP1_9BACT|nr:glycosyltransferase [Chitinophaga cymbidii]GEP97299.1 hypothetical protein CCY01nite_35590 [Chitinophaga cymbidii]
MKPLSIIIITYNRPDDLLDLCRNIAEQEDAAALLENVVIVNNGSTIDYSPVTDFIAAHRDIPFEYKWSDQNLGVVGGRNMAIGLARAAILITLDDDAYFRDADALKKVLQAFEHPFTTTRPFGAMAFKVLYTANGEMQQNAFPHKEFELYRDKPHFLAPYYIGCGHAITREAYEAAGLYPEDFFYGMEEYDLGYRIIDKGYAIAYEASVVVMHKESPLARVPNETKMRMLWTNKAKVTYRYLPLFYFVTASLLWSLEYLKKTSWDLKGWLKGWNIIRRIPAQNKRQPLSDEAMEYLHQAAARLWY